jgi:hypothetical protein
MHTNYWIGVLDYQAIFLFRDLFCKSKYFDLLISNPVKNMCCNFALIPHGSPTEFGPPTGTGTGRVLAPISNSGPGRGLEFGDRGGDGECSPGSAPPRCHPELGKGLVRLWGPHELFLVLE